MLNGLIEADMVFDFAEFNTLAVNFNLVVLPSNKSQTSVMMLSYKISSLIESALGIIMNEG
jgi:hypothetical protein